MVNAARAFEVKPEWRKAFPADWALRLREISPVTDRVSHLRERWREDTSEWWLYECTPAQMLTPGRVTQLSKHWSELPTAEQQGRKTFVTEYQFYMWQEHRVDVRPFWVLQGSKFVVGGTPYAFTEREQKLLEAANEPGEPIPPGTLPNIPFDERVVRAIQARDRLLKYGGDLDRMQKASAADALKREDSETEQEYRRRFLDWHKTNNAPSAEFMKWYLKQKESRDTLPPAPTNLANAITDFRDRYIETGHLGAGPASSRLLIPVH